MRWTLLLLLAFFIQLLSCTYTEKIRTGKQAIERKQYAVAIPLLKKEIGKSKSRVEKGKLNFLLGQAYQKTNKITASLDYYKAAYDFQYGYEALEAYARGLMQDEQYTAAIEAFDMLGLEIGSTYEYRDEIQSCKRAIVYKKEKEYAAFKVELADFNSGQSDYAPSLWENKLVISSDRTSSEGEEKYNWTKQQFSDLYKIEEGKISPFASNINTKYHEGTATFTADGKTMYFTKCGDDGKKEDDYCELYVSYLENDGAWTSPTALDFQIEGFNYLQPAISEDGKLLYFASDNQFAMGGFDIFWVEKTNSGWSEPKSLGFNVNTVGNELFPSIDKDTLHFSSNHWQGLGGLDIFKTFKRRDGKWAPPQNLLYPLNSGGDDFSYVIVPSSQLKKGELKKGYFASNRKDGDGQDDIYQFTKIVPKKRPLPPPPPPKDSTKTIVEIEYKWTLEIIVLQKIYENPNEPESRVLGRKGITEANLSQFLSGTNTQFKTDKDGILLLDVLPQQDYIFTASKAGFLTNDIRYSTADFVQDPAHPITQYSIEIELEQIFENKEIVLDDIYYDFNKSFIREDAKPSLLKLASILNKNPSINIELSSHTDCRGTSSYNQKLSQKRAQSAVDFLIQQGIARERLTASGYGASLPKSDCKCRNCSETEHQLNRRTAFKIISGS